MITLVFTGGFDDVNVVMLKRITGSISLPHTLHLSSWFSAPHWGHFHPSFSSDSVDSSGSCVIADDEAGAGETSLPVARPHSGQKLPLVRYIHNRM